MMMNQNQVEVKASMTVWGPVLWGILGRAGTEPLVSRPGVKSFSFGGVTGYFLGSFNEKADKVFSRQPFFS